MDHRAGGGHRDAGYRRDYAPVQLGRRSHVCRIGGPLLRDPEWWSLTPGERQRGEGVNRPWAAGRNLRVEATLSADEADQLASRARAAGVSRARYLIDAALDRPDTISERRAWAREVERAERVMRTVATNVNQLARLARSTGRIPEGTGETLTAVREASAALMSMARAAGYRPEES
jgi:uncharacterized protein (DUF1778 family)